MASSFQKTTFKKQQALLEALARNLHSHQASESSIEGTVRQFQQRLRYHRFLDTHPTDTEELLKSVEEHLLLESQVAKRNALVDLKKELIDVDWVSHTGDIQYAVLRLLANLARRPGASVIPQSTVRREVASEWQDEGEVELSDWGDELDLCGSQSDLSQWSVEEQEPQGSHLGSKPGVSLDKSDGDQLQALDKHEYQGNPVAPEEPAGLLALTNNDWGGENVMHGNLADLEETTEEVGSLLHSISRVLYTDGRPFGSRITTEAVVVKECLHALQGIPGPVFLWNKEHRFTVLESLHIPQFSPTALRNLLSYFARIATKVKVTSDWAREVVWECSENSPGLQYAEMYGCVFPTLVAFADALQSSLNKAIRPLVKLEQDIESNHELQSSLVFLKILIRGVENKVSLLDMCRRKVHESLLERKVIPREGCKMVLDTLYSLLDEAEETGGSSGYSEQYCIWQVFCASLQPLLSSLSSWLFLGESSEVSEEFFISRNHDPNIELTEFWHRGYHTAAPSVPSFLSSVSMEIQEGGKALHVLRSEEYHDRLQTKTHDVQLEDRLADLVDPNWTSDLLHDNLMHFLQHVLQTQQIEATLGAKESIMHGMALAGHCRSSYELPTTCGMSLPWEQNVASDSDENEDVFRIPEAKSPVAHESCGEDPMNVTSSHNEEVEKHVNSGDANQPVEDFGTEDSMDEDTSSSEEERVTLEHQHRSRLTALEDLSKDIQQSTVTSMGTTADGYGALARVCPFPTRLAAFDGCVLGTSYERPSTTGSSRPVPDCCGTMPRLDLVLKQGFISLVEERSREVVRVMLECLLEDMGMRHDFTMLQDIFCMRSRCMVEWVRKFCRNLNQDITIPFLKQYDVTNDLQECLGSLTIPLDGESCMELSVALSGDGPHGKMCEEGYMHRHVAELDNVVVEYPIMWPLCLAFSKQMHADLGKVLAFLMKLEWVTCTAEDAWLSIASCRRNDWEDLVGRTLGMDTRLKGWHHVQSSLYEILHIARSLKKCIAWRMDKCIMKFEKGLDTVNSVGMLQSILEAVISEVKAACFRTDEGQLKRCRGLLFEVLDHSLNLATMTCAMDKQGAKPSELAAALEKQFPLYERARHELLKFMHVYNSSHCAPAELNSMVFLLNFNDFYPKYDLLTPKEHMVRGRNGKGDQTSHDVGFRKRTKRG